MCSPATCRKCGGITWTGCGDHADQVMAGVPVERRCTCPETDEAKPQGGALRRLLRR